MQTSETQMHRKMITEDELEQLAGKYLDGGETDADLDTLVDACHESVQHDGMVIAAFIRRMQGQATDQDHALLNRVANEVNQEG